MPISAKKVGPDCFSLYLMVIRDSYANLNKEGLPREYFSASDGNHGSDADHSQEDFCRDDPRYILIFDT